MKRDSTCSRCAEVPWLHLGLHAAAASYALLLACTPTSLLLHNARVMQRLLLRIVYSPQQPPFFSTMPVSTPVGLLGCKGYCSESYTAHTNFASFPQFLHLLHGCMVADAIAQSLIQLKAANTGTNGSIGLALFGVCPTQRCRQSASQQSSMFTRLVCTHLDQKTAKTRRSNACAYAQQPLAEMHVAVPVIKHLSC